MTPPLHVKAVGSLSSIVLGTMGLRDIFAPGVAIPLFGKAAAQRHLWAGLEASELSPGQVACSSMLGFALLTVAASKLATLFSGKEGTFLRRNLLLVFGALDLAFSTTMLRFEKEFRVAGASIQAFSLLNFVEGAVFLYDALCRPRPRKPSSKPSKGQ